MKHYKLAAYALIAGPLSLLANTATDKQIESTAESSYNYRSVLNHDVKVKSNDGVVTLTGRVESAEQKRLAEDTVSDLPGVVSVNNELKVKGAKEGSDDWIALKIRSQLLMRANVSLTDTKVTVMNGVVTLNGRADNQAQKDLTTEYVKDIEGVRSVDNNIMVADKDSVSANHDNTATRSNSSGEKIDDSSITAQVKYELFSHKSTSAIKTKVNTNGGNVVISGDASSDAEKDLVTKLAKSVRGVQSVDNNMMVRN